MEKMPLWVRIVLALVILLVLIAGSQVLLWADKMAA